MTDTLEVLEEGLRRVKHGWNQGSLTSGKKSYFRDTLTVCALGGLVPERYYTMGDDWNDNYEVFQCDGACLAVDELARAVERSEWYVFYGINRLEEKRAYLQSHPSHRNNVDHQLDVNIIFAFNDSQESAEPVIKLYEEAIKSYKEKHLKSVVSQVEVRELDLATAGD